MKRCETCIYYEPYRGSEYKECICTHPFSDVGFTDANWSCELYQDADMREENDETD